MSRGTAGARGGTRAGAGPSGSPAGGVTFTLAALGVVHSPFHPGRAVPKNFERFARGTVEIFPDEPAALRDLAEGDLVWLVTYCTPERASGRFVREKAPCRRRSTLPTRGTGRLALTLVRLAGRRGNILEVEGLDLDDGTPLLDVKPYFAHRDRPGPLG